LLPPFFYTAPVSKQNPIYLIGMMGVGKSTVGTQLAARLGREFVDTDREVERIAGRKIAEIFESEGEAHFRRLEAEAIEAASSRGSVIALGGGAAAHPGVIDRLNARGETVFLMAEPRILVQRIGDPSNRPLLAGLDRDACVAKLTRLLADRSDCYRQAKFQLEADGRAEDVVERIVVALGLE
jgi:shikimate kinase